MGGQKVGNQSDESSEKEEKIKKIREPRVFVHTNFSFPEN